jgi:hypothetical protein
LRSNRARSRCRLQSLELPLVDGVVVVAEVPLLEDELDEDELDEDELDEDPSDFGFVEA